MIFTGPENTIIELRSQNKGWTLHVNGYVVEDYNPNRRAHGDDTLHCLRSKPDGSYLITPSFDISEVEMNIVRKFQFMLGDAGSQRLHEVRVAHSDCIWQVSVDGHLVARESHRITDCSGEADFIMTGPSGEHVPSIVTMEWPASIDAATCRAWIYRLVVNGMEIPACWTKVGGPVQLAATPSVFLHVASYAQVPEQHALVSAPAPFPEALSTWETVAPPPPAVMPQGVSFDSIGGHYQANIRNRAGKFVFLGEFLSAEEAHQAYINAVPVHCPDKQLVPGFPGY